MLAHYDDGRPSQLRLDASVSGFDITYVQAIYYPGENQIQTVMQQGDLFSKQEQLFAVVAMGATTLLTVDLDVEVTMPVPKPMVKKMVNDALDHLADNLKKRAEAARCQRLDASGPEAQLVEPGGEPPGAVGELARWSAAPPRRRRGGAGRRSAFGGWPPRCGPTAGRWRRCAAAGSGPRAEGTRPAWSAPRTG